VTGSKRFRVTERRTLGIMGTFIAYVFHKYYYNNKIINYEVGEIYKKRGRDEAGIQKYSENMKSTNSWRKLSLDVRRTLWSVDLLLRNDREISNYTKAVAK
jgi:hypothetical protein